MSTGGRSIIAGALMRQPKTFTGANAQTVRRLAGRTTTTANGVMVADGLLSGVECSVEERKLCDAG
jgi:hypothetical protein